MTAHRQMATALYRVVNLANGKDYVGVSVDPARRWRVHRSDAARGSRLAFHAAIRKYGADTFDWRIVARCRNYDAALRLEKLARKMGLGVYNMTQGGEGMLGRSPSPETREKSAAARRGAKRSADARARMSAAKKGRPALNRGVPMSEAQKEKLRLAKTGVKATPAQLRGLQVGWELRRKKARQ